MLPAVDVVGRVTGRDTHQPLHLALANAELRKMPNGIDEVVEVGAGPPPRATHDGRLLRDWQPTDVARMAALNGVGEGCDHARMLVGIRSANERWRMLVGIRSAT